MSGSNPGPGLPAGTPSAGGLNDASGGQKEQGSHRSRTASLELGAVPDDSAEAGSGEFPDLPDPLERVLLQQAPRLSPPGPSASAAVVERVAADLVRRCWVQADSRSGRVRLELGGAHHGTVVELVFDGNAGQLDVDVEMAEDAAAGTERFLRGLGARLRDKGLPLGAFEVRGVRSS